MIFNINSTRGHTGSLLVTPKMTLGGREKACKIIGCNSEYFWGYSHSNFLFYILRFCPCD